MCGRPAHIVFILRTISAKHKYEINIGAWSGLSILISRIHKHINGKRGDFLAYGEKKKNLPKYDVINQTSYRIRHTEKQRKRR